MSWSERLSALDATFLYVEDRAAHMHVGAVWVFDGPAPSRAELVGHVAGVLPLMPRYRQRLAFVPLGAGRPVWIDDARLDVEAHVRRVFAPPPGGAPELDAVAGDLFGQPLPRDRPLWELWLVDGLGDGRFAVVSKAHHCLTDGVAGAELVVRLCEGAAAPAPPWTPRPAPGPAARAVTALAGQVAGPLAGLARAVAGGPGPALRSLGELAAGVSPLLRLAALGRAPPSPLNGPIGSRRRWTTAAVDLAAVKAARTRLGCTVNDLVLAVIAGALRALLLARGERPPEALQALVPVSVRRADGRGLPGNHVSAVLCPLPVGEPDPIRRLDRVVREMDRLKADGQALGALLWVKLGALVPPALLAGVARNQSGRPYMNVVVTNVPGPQRPLHLLGRRMRAWYPLVPLAPRQALSVAAQSYDGAIGFGLLGDAGADLDLPLLARAIPAGLAELAALAPPPAAG